MYLRLFRVLLLSAAMLQILPGCGGGASTAETLLGLPPIPIPTPKHADIFAAGATTLTAASFRWVAVKGPAGGLAVAECGTGYRVIGGGASSSNGSAIGGGFAKTSANAWLAQAAGSVVPYAFASCVSTRVPAATIRWYTGVPTNGVATVTCPTGTVLISGYGDTTSGTLTKEYVNTANHSQFWVTGGATAHASCGLLSAGIYANPTWNTTQNQKSVFSSCKGGVVIGGLMGDTSWPGPPVQEHQSSSTGSSGTAGWLVFGKQANTLSWVTCIPT